MTAVVAVMTAAMAEMTAVIAWMPVAMTLFAAMTAAESKVAAAVLKV